MCQLYDRRMDVAHGREPAHAENGERKRRIIRTLNYLENSRSTSQPHAPYVLFIADVAYANGAAILRGEFEITENNWFKFIVPMVKCSMHIYEANENLPNGKKIGHSPKIIPQHSMDPINITLDKLSIFQINNAEFGRRNRDIQHNARNAKFATNDLNDFIKIWTHCFDIGKLSATQQEHFAFFGKTNGVHLNLLFHAKPQEPVALEQTIAEFERGDFPQYGGIDAGYMYPIAYTKIEAMDNFRESIGYLSSKRYSALMKRKKHNDAIMKVTKKYVQLQNSLQAACFKRFGERASPTSPQYHLYRFHRLRVFDVGIRERIIPKTIARREFEFYRNKQRVGAKIANELASGENTLLAMDRMPVQQNSPIRGYNRAPLKWIDRVIRNHPLITVVDTSEAYTSQKCSFCFNQLEIRCRNKKRTVQCRNCNRLANPILLPAQQFRKLKMLSKDVQTKPFNARGRPIPQAEMNNMHRDGDASRCMVYLLLCKMLQQQRNAAFTHAGNQ